MRLNLAGNDDWIRRYFSKILPMLSSQHNSVLSVIPNIALANSKDKGVYQLLSVPKIQIQSIESNGDHLLIGAFKTVYGDLNRTVLLWKHPTLTSALNFSTKQSESKSFQTFFNLI